MTTEKFEIAVIGLSEGSQGDKVRSLQNFLRRYGYLGRPRATMGEFETDETFAGDSIEYDGEDALDGVMDKPTCDGLRSFQQFAGLQVTGEVDEATHSELNSKRCGVPDVAEYATGAGKWSTNNLTYSFQNYTTDIQNNTIIWAIDQAFALWSAETPLRFRRVANGTSGDIVIRFVTGDHGDGSPFDGRSGVLAHAFYPSNSGPIRGDSHFDDAETWTVAVPPGSGTDLVSVAAHEFGHALGLKHSNVRNALMYPTYTGPHRFLDPDDIAGIQSLYGGPGSIENATWIHGNAAVVELPDLLDSQKHYGYFYRVIGKPNTTNWIHFSVPTPVIEDGNRLSIDRFMLRANTGSAATLRDVHIRDGSRVIALHNGVNRSGNLSFEKFGVASVPDVRWGLSVSLGFTFSSSGSSSQRRVDLISAGFDFKP